MKRGILSLSTLALALVAACSEPTAVTSKAASSALNPNGPPSAITINPGGGFVGFGPVSCVRERGKPKAISFTFTATAGQTATLHVVGNGVEGLNGAIFFNGRRVVSNRMLHPDDGQAEHQDEHQGGDQGEHQGEHQDEHQDEHQAAGVNISVPLTLAAQNTLVCKLEGKPGSGVSLSVTP